MGSLLSVVVHVNFVCVSGVAGIAGGLDAAATAAAVACDNKHTRGNLPSGRHTECSSHTAHTVGEVLALLGNSSYSIGLLGCNKKTLKIIPLWGAFVAESARALYLQNNLESLRGLI